MKKILYLILPMVYFATWASAQNCAVISIPDSLIGCPGNVKNIAATITNGASASLVQWLPATNLSNSSILNPDVTFGNTNTTYTVSVTSTGANLFTNPAFDLNLANYTTGYIPGPGGTWGPLSVVNSFMVTSNPNLAHSNFPVFGDHTTGTGNMMVVNGSSTPNTNVACQSITVLPNTTYTLSVWAAACDPGSPASLQFNVNGAPVGTALNLTTITANWTQLTTTWTSGPTTTTANVCIIDNVLAGGGNDFAIDDFSMTTSCVTTDSITIKPKPINIDFNFTPSFGCSSDTVKFTSINLPPGNPILSYLWSFGDLATGSNANPTHVYATQSNYPVSLIASNGTCADTVTKSVNLLHPLDAQFVVNKNAMCLGDALICTNASVGTNATYQWYMGDGSPVLTTQHANYTYADSGTYTITLVVTDFIGCKDSTTQQVYVEKTYPFSFTASKINACVGDVISFTDSIVPFIKGFEYDFGDNNTSTQHNPIHLYDQAQSPYQVVLSVFYNYCPNQTKKIDIFVNDAPIVNLAQDTTICPNNAIMLVPTVFGAYNAVKWSNGDNTATTTITQPGYYWVEVKNGNCVSADTIFVKRDCYLNIPNTFTPDNDGKNDYFLPRLALSEGLLSISINIFNRWGEKVFTSTKIDGQGWDGKFGNQPQPLGTYMYQITAVFKNLERKTYTGNITLIR